MIISEVKQIQVWVDGPERLIEKAYVLAIPKACDEFGINEDNHSLKLKNWERRNSSLKIKLNTVEATGNVFWDFCVTFDIWCEKDEDME